MKPGMTFDEMTEIRRKWGLTIPLFAQMLGISVSAHNTQVNRAEVLKRYQYHIELLDELPPSVRRLKFMDRIPRKMWRKDWREAGNGG